MNVHPTISEIRTVRWRQPDQQWGLVPTMGYLHEGHLSLVRRARAENDQVGVSIFVNPTQFNNAADLETYPRNMEQDLAMLRAEGVDLVWTPTPDIVYPPAYQTYVDVEQVTKPLEGAARGSHFRGVATVVSKLFNVFQPQRAYFGQKDAQQVIVIKQMVQDLNFNLELVVCPTVREPDGLAMSSRNVHLSPVARRQAACLYQALQEAKTAYEQGQHNGEQLRAIMRSVITTQSLARVDYVSIAHLSTLTEMAVVAPPALFSLAVFVDEVRLIDNLILE